MVSLRERGQVSLVLVVGLVILAIGMYTTYTLSRTAYEKIRLQNAADATAYSIATREARAFNFSAFANRTQIASYAQLLEYHGAYSNMLFQAAMLGFWGDVLQSLGNFIHIPILVSSGQMMTAAYDALTASGIALEVQLIAFAARTEVLNTAFFVLSAAMVMSAAAQVADGDIEMAHRNDPLAQTNSLSTLLNALNAAQFGLAIDPRELCPWLVDPAAKARAERLITELVNGSRYGMVPANVVDRDMNSWVGTELSQIGAGMAGNTTKSIFNVFNAGIQSMDALLSDGTSFVGTTKLVDQAGTLGTRPPLEQMAMPNADYSYLNPGNVVMSKDTFARGRLMESGVASITSTRRGSTVCAYDRMQVPQYGFHWPQLVASPTGAGFVCSQRPILMGGIGRYIGYGAPRTSVPKCFLSGTFELSSARRVIFLNKPASSWGLAGGGDLRFTVQRGPQSARLDTTPKSLTGGVLEGMSALSRAQVYYHRPGAWQEPPNLFNPYWGVRLAPKRDALNQLAQDAGLSGAFLDLIADNVTMF